MVMQEGVYSPLLDTVWDMTVFLVMFASITWLFLLHSRVQFFHRCVSLQGNLHGHVSRRVCFCKSWDLAKIVHPITHNQVRIWT